MKASVLIKNLQKLVDEVGDCEVKFYSGATWNYYNITEIDYEHPDDEIILYE